MTLSDLSIASMLNFQSLVIALWLRKEKSLFLGHGCGSIEG